MTHGFTHGTDLRRPGARIDWSVGCSRISPLLTLFSESTPCGFRRRVGRHLAFTRGSTYRWKGQYGGMEVSQLRQLNAYLGADEMRLGHRAIARTLLRNAQRLCDQNFAEY